jgi:UDP-N-acetyl-D-glucosamine dehydrogenase
MRSCSHLPPVSSVGLTAELVREMDAVLISTDHSAVDYEMLAKNAQLIVDTRGVYRTPRNNVVKA